MSLPASRWLVGFACVVATVLPATVGATGDHTAAPSVPSATTVVYASRVTDLNLLGITLTNYGFFGNNFVSRSPSLEYPLGGGFEHLLRGGLWVGAHATDGNGAFTGVTTACIDGFQGTAPAGGTEFTPASDVIVRRSNLPTSPFFDPQAVSNMDYLCAYDDLTPRAGSPENHRPLGVHVRQSAYSWAFGDLSHIVFTRFSIRNDGSAPLTDLWVGLYTEFASGNKNAYASWPPTSASGPGSWFGKAWLQYDAALRLLREHYCLGQPVPAGCNLAAVPYWAGLELLTPPSAGQNITLAAFPYAPGDPTRDQDVERYAYMSAGTLADLTLPDLMPGTGDPVEFLALGPFSMLAPADSVVVDFAWLGGGDVTEIQEHARSAQQVYDENYSPPTATVVSVAASSADERGAHLLWNTGEPGWSGTVERAEPGLSWHSLAMRRADGSGLLAYDDATVEPGKRYGYRLTSGAQSYGETWIDVPGRASFALLGLAPNPIQRGDWSVSFALPRPGRAELELFDSAGRRVLHRSYDVASAGMQNVTVGRAEDLRAGLYHVRLTYDHRSLTSRFVVLH